MSTRKGSSPGRFPRRKALLVAVAAALAVVALIIPGLSSAAGGPTAVLTSAPTPATGKAPLTISFDGTASSDSDGTIVSWTLSYGDNTPDDTGTLVLPSNLSHTYSAPGNYTATLTVTDDLSASDSDSVAVTANANVAPTASLTSTPTPATGKAPLNVIFNGSGSSDSDGSIASWTLHFGDGSADATGTGAPPSSRSHTYSPGNYTATLTVTDDSDATGQATVAVTAKANVAPTASLTSSPTPATGKAPLTVTFNGSASADSDGTIASWTLAFGDGQSVNNTTPGVNLASIQHTYSAAGTDTATLTVTDDNGATGTATVTVTPKANVAPTAVLTSSPTPATGKAPLSITFNGSGSSDSDGSIASWTLNFGDGTTLAAGNGVPPSSLPHTYAAGSWTAVLTVKDDNGATDTDSVSVSANAPPTAALTADKTGGPTPLTVTFNGSGSTDSDGSIASWTLFFGDTASTSGTGAVPSSIPHTYTSACTCTASLTVTDNQGAQSVAKTVAISVSTNRPPVASLSGTPTIGTMPLDVTFDGSASNDPDGIALKSWSLDFGDLTPATTGTGAVPSSIVHTYAADGTYNAVLTVTDSSNASRSSTPVTIAVNKQPSISVADVSQSEGNSGSTSFVFQLLLSAVSTHDVKVDYATADGSATAGSDYTATSGTLTVPAGTDCTTPNAACQLPVTVNGDPLYEPNETFGLNLSNAVGATILDGAATGTIVNDDTRPVLMIQDNAVIEGNAGSQVDGAQSWALNGNLKLKDASGFPNTFGHAFVVTDPGTRLVSAYTYQSVSGNTLVGVSPAGSVTTGQIASQPRPIVLNVFLCDPTRMSPDSTATADCVAGNSVSPSGAETVSGVPTTVHYSTADGHTISTSAPVVVGEDYVYSEGTLTIPAGAKSGQITVQEIPNTIPENPDPLKDRERWFLVNLANAVNADIRWGHGNADILEDDGLNPPSSTTGGGSAIGTDHVTVSGTVNPNNAATDVYVQYGPTDSYGSQTGTTHLPAGNSDQTLSFSLTGLSAGTTYHYQLVATHPADGVTGYGKDATFKTDAPPAAVLVPNKTSGTQPLTVTFNGAGSSDPDGSIVSWALAFGDGASTSGSGAVPSVIAHTYTSACTCIASLTVADNQGAQSAPATVGIAVGNPQPPPGGRAPKLSTYDVPVLKPTTATIAFHVDPNGAATKVWVEYGTTSSYGQMSSARAIPAGATQDLTFTLKGLAPQTLYHFRLRAAHTTDSGAVQSVDLTFRTPKEKPMHVTLAARSLRPNSKGVLSLNFSCAGSLLKRCNGQALLELGNRTAGFKSFWVLPKHRKLVHVQLSRFVLRQLLARKRLRLDLTLSVRTGLFDTTSLSTKPITILLPRPARKQAAKTTSHLPKGGRMRKRVF